MRFGQLLVDAGLVTETQVLDALEAQEARGGRLGTVVNELGLLDLDTVSRCVGCQYDLPAALGRHFAHADRTLQQLFSAEIAERYSCVPLLRVGKRVVTASVAPLDEAATAEVARELGIAAEHVVQSVAAELRIQEELERLYGIVRSPRWLRHAAPRWPAGSAPSIDVIELEADEALDISFATVEDAVRAAAFAPTNDTFDAALHRVRCSIDRDDIAELATDAISRFIPACSGAAVLGIDNGVARSWASYRHGETDVEPIALAIGDSALLRAVMRRREIVRVASGDLVHADYDLLMQLGTEAHELVFVPLFVGECVSAVIVAGIAPGARASELSQLGWAVGAALTRLRHEVEIVETLPAHHA